MIERVKRTIEAFRLIDEGDRVVVAVSGGPDSVALLKILLVLSPHYKATLMVSHLNHGLRGDESDREEAFVEDLSRSMGLPFTSRKVDIRGIMGRRNSSPEDTCRRVRYDFLEEIRQRAGFQKIALGHHLNDQAETVVMRFLRGSGMEGLKGMLPMRDHTFIRPLIEITRREIIAFLEREGTAYMLDSSNEKEICLRNRIRQRLMPELASGYNPRLVENIGRTAEILRQEDDYLQRATEDILLKWGSAGTENGPSIPLEEFRSLHGALQGRVVRALLLKASDRKMGVGYRHVKAVLGIARGENPSIFLDMPGRVRVRREYDRLRFEKRKEAETKGVFRENKEAGGAWGDYCRPVMIPGEVAIPETGHRLTFRFAERSEVFFTSRKTVFLDCDGMEFPLTVRNWHPGDRMDPLGMKGTKKIQDLFIDEKVPRNRRREIPLLVDRSSVLWVAGIRLSERVRIKGGTKRVLKIEII